MAFGDAVGTCLRKYVDFSGRARRPELWWFVLFVSILTCFASVVDTIVFDTDRIQFGIFLFDQGPVGKVVTVLLVLPMLAVGARRLHDIGRSAWWLAIGLVPCVGFVVLLVFFCTGSQGRANTYGELPA